MESTRIDIEAFIRLRDCIYKLTKYDFSLYDSSARLLVPSISADPVIGIFATSVEARKEHKGYLKNAIEKAILRRRPSLFVGPMRQYHYFLPIQTDDARLVLVGNAFYTSLKDLDDFFVTKGQSWGLSGEHMNYLQRQIILSENGKVSEAYENICQLFNLAINDSFEKRVSQKRYRQMLTIMELFYELGPDVCEEKVHGLLCEAIVYLFDGDTVSVLVQDEQALRPVITAGRLREKLESVSLTCNTSVSEALKNNTPFCSAETIELLRIGCPDEVISIHVFPLAVGGKTFGLLAVFNTQFTKEEVDTITKLCLFSAFLLRTIISHRMIHARADKLIAVNLALDLSQELQNPDALYQAIVEVSSKLINAEKVSLMLPEGEHMELLIKAVKGINKWIAKNIRVKVGEGIAGRVYKEGRAMVVTDIEQNLSTQKRPLYRTGSFACVPLKIGDETIGILNFADKVTGGVFSEWDMEFIRFFASYASVAIKGAQYYSMSEEMKQLSITDSLTGIFNRRYFDDRLSKELQRTLRYDSVFSLAIFDIDNFKLFNDTEGHAAGDQVLKAIADISGESLRSIDILARFGGEEFAIIMPETEKEEAFLVAERVRKNIKEYMPTHWKNFPRERLTVSIGVAAFPADGRDAKTLIKNTDRALYQAKTNGKDRTVSYGIS